MKSSPIALAFLALAFLPGVAAADAQPTGVLAAPFRMVPGQPILVVVQMPAAQLPAGTKLLGKALPLSAEQQEGQSWFSRLAVAAGAAPAVSTCIVAVALPDGRTVESAPGECLGALNPAGPLQLDEDDLMTVRAGTRLGVALTPQAAAQVSEMGGRR